MATFALGAEHRLCIAAVGATLVGKVRVVFDDLTTQAGAAPTLRGYPQAERLAKGQEWGRFEFGSTLVMLATPGALSLEAATPGTPLRLGSRIGVPGVFRLAEAECAVRSRPAPARRS